MLWRNHDFLKLWTGQTISLFGSLLGALPFTAIFVLHASAMEMAALSVAQLSPGLVAAPAAGIWADRLRRRPIMIAADAGRAALLGWVFAAAAMDILSMEQLYFVAFALGALGIFFDVAYRAYLPSLVEPQALMEGNAKLAASASVAEAGSFSVGGWIVQLASAQVAVIVDAVSFLVSAVSLGAIRASEPPPVPKEAREGAMREMREGLAAIAGDSLLRALALANASRYFAYGAIGAVILLFVTTGELGMQPGLAGVIFGIGGVSSLVAAGIAGRASRLLGAGPAMIAGLFVAGLAALCIPLAPDASIVGVTFLVAQQLFGDSADTVFAINEVSLRQAIVPGALLGRVDANIRFASMGAMLVGALAAGAIASQSGLRAALFAGTSGLFGAAAIALFSPLRSLRSAPADPGA